jgi:hypothetical protein
VEVQRLVNSSGIITLANQVIAVGSPLAGQRARIRLDGQVMRVITQDGILWRTLPCPIPPSQRHKLPGVRLAGPQPLPPAGPVIQRKVSSRGGIQVARQRIHIGLRSRVSSVDGSFCIVERATSAIDGLLSRDGQARRFDRASRAVRQPKELRRD